MAVSCLSQRGSLYLPWGLNASSALNGMGQASPCELQCQVGSSSAGLPLSSQSSLETSK